MPLCPHCGIQVEYCPSCGQPLTAGAAAAQAELPAQRAFLEQCLWEGRPGFRAGLKSQTATYRVTSKRVQIVHTGFSHKVEEIDLARFRAARVVRSLLQRGPTGNVMILSSDPTTSMLMFEDISEPEQVQEIICKAAHAEMERLGVHRPAEA